MARARRRLRPRRHAGDRPAVLRIDLLPRARRHPVRDRDRPAGLRRRRGRGRARHAPEAADAAREAPGEDRARPATDSGARVSDDPHAQGPVARGGAPWARAGLAMILLHGRGGSSQDMLALAEHLALPDIACVAPEAAGNSWWPQSFLAPIAANEPALS